MGPAWSDSLYQSTLRHWASTQSRLTEISTRAQQVNVPNSHHGLPFSSPGAVVEAIRSLVVLALPASR